MLAAMDRPQRLVFVALAVIACSKPSIAPIPESGPPAADAATERTSVAAAPEPEAASPAANAAENSAAGEPIDRLVSWLSARPLWKNGMSPKIDLPPSASAEDVLTRVFASTGFDEGHVKRHAIRVSKQVRIGADTAPYTAVLVETDLGDKIVLLRHEPPSGWWSRVFDASGHSDGPPERAEAGTTR